MKEIKFSKLCKNCCNTGQQEYFTTKREPYLCPVCNGKGVVPNGFYIVGWNYESYNTAMNEQCQSCGGTGIVWG